MDINSKLTNNQHTIGTAVAKRKFNFSDLKTQTKILIGACSPLILLAILAGIVVTNLNSIVDTNEQVGHTYEVLADASS